MQAKIPDPNRCGADGIACGPDSEKLCCIAKTQLCCAGVVHPYCAQTCP